MIDAAAAVFFLLSLGVIAGAVYFVGLDKVVHATLAAAFSFVALAGLYVMLGAEFLAFVQVLVYAGAVTILMIFGIMMTRHGDESERPSPAGRRVAAFIGSALLFGALFWAIRAADFGLTTTPEPQDNVRRIGESFLTDYVVAFELLSVLLTAAFIGAVAIAKREEEHK